MNAPVEQVDREAAADLVARTLSHSRGAERLANMIVRGRADSILTVQAFAAARLAERERCATASRTVIEDINGVSPFGVTPMQRNNHLSPAERDVIYPLTLEHDGWTQTPNGLWMMPSGFCNPLPLESAFQIRRILADLDDTGHPEHLGGE